MSDDLTVAFLKAILRGGPHSLNCQPPGEKFRTIGFVKSPEDVAPLLDKLQDVDTWISAHPLKAIPSAGRGGDQDVAEVRAIPADLDWAHWTRRTDKPLPTEEEVRRRLGQIDSSLRPSIVVHSGHGLQAWWLLASPVTPDEGAGLIAQINALLDSVGLENGRSDLASILRLPGTRNLKGDPVPVAVESICPERLYVPEHLRKYLPKATAASIGKGTRHHGGSVTDAQQALCNFVIEHHGGHSVRVDGDGEMYLWRPGKTPRDGRHAATVLIGNQGDPILTVFSDNWSGLAKGSYVLGIDGELHHPSDVTARIRFGTNSTPPPSRSETQLPEEFWTRPLHASVRDAAAQIGVSAEGLMLTVLALVAAHVPPAIWLPGPPRRGTVNVLVCPIGPPGTGKGTLLDRAAELVPYPTAPVGCPHDYTRHHRLATGSGFIKAFYRSTTKAEKTNDPNLGEWVRHGGPVVIRNNEIDKFAAATRRNSDNGDRLLGELKQAVSGEALGSSFATRGLDLQPEALSYRVVGLLGTAPAKAKPLFDDLGGGLPERLVFAPVLPSGGLAPLDPGPFTPGQGSSSTCPPPPPGSLSPLGWSLPKPLPIGQHFSDAPEVTDWLNRSWRWRQVHPGDPLDAHRDYLRHMLSALVGLFDGRWDSTGEDFALAGMLMGVSVAVRARLLKAIAEEDRKAGEVRAKQARQSALAVDAAVSAQHQQRDDQLWVAKRAVKIAEQVKAKPGVTVGELRQRVEGLRRAFWDQALEKAKTDGLVTEREEPGQGTAMRCLYPGTVEP